MVSAFLTAVYGLQLSFQMWTNQMQETLTSKKKGDVAFRHKDFRAVIECYTQVRISLLFFSECQRFYSPMSSC